MKTTTSRFKIAVLIITAIFSIQVKAQEICGYGMAHDYFMSTDPEYAKNSRETEERIREITQNQSGRAMTTNVLNIPVVVHVVHIGEAVGTGSNISDAQILGAIQGMNDKYKAVNGFGVDMQINFCLAVRDPNGNPTTGINRVNGAGVTNYVSSGMFAIASISPGTCFNNYAAIKDLSKWPPTKYLNIWVVYKYCLSAGYSLYGQATGQTGGAYDGVTILYSQMTQSSITLAHEVGHMLLLNHTFQGDGGGVSCPVDTSCANNGDLVCDTPPHKTNDWGTINPCSSSGVWDNSRYNYMGYAWAAGPTATFNETTCRFTQGQKDRARAAIFAMTTVDYLNSNGCTPPSALDAGIKNFSYPTSTAYTSDCAFPNALSPVVLLKNYGLNTLTSVTINYKADNNSINTFNWTGNLMKDSSEYVTLPAVLLSQGAHTFLAYTTNPNGVADSYNSNDSANTVTSYLLQQTSFMSLSTSGTNPSCQGTSDGTASVSAVSSASKFEVKEDWEGSTDWTIVNGSEINHWMIGTATANGGNKGIYVTKDNSTYAYQLNTSSSVHFYKDFYFPPNATNIKVKFDWKCDGEGGGFNGVDRLRVYLIPTTQFPQAGYQLGVSPFFTSTSIGSYYSQPTYRTDSIMGLDANAGSVKRLVFNWRNNAAAGVQSPAAVDNIIVSYDLPAVSTFNYSWNTTPVQTTAVATSLPANTYTITVTDGNNCISTGTVTLTQPPPFNVSITANNTTTFCLGDSVILSSSSASSYLWSNGDISQSTIVKTSGSYSVTATDANGCSGTSNLITVTVLPVSSCSAGISTKDLSGVKVFPNPASDYLNIEGNLEGNGDYNLMIMNEFGQVVISEKLRVQNNFILKSVSIKELPAGMYFLELKSDHSRFTTRINKMN